MRYRKPIIALCLLLCAALAAALVLGSGGSDRRPRIALVLKTTVETAEFWSEVLDGVYSAEDELDVDVTVTGSSSETAVDEQIAIMEETIASNPDAIILVSSDYDRLADVTRQASAAGIHVLTMDSDVNTDARTTFVASDNYEIGQQLGNQLLEHLDGGQVAVLTHSTLSSSGIRRVDGALDVLEQCPDVEVVGVYDCENSRTEAAAIARKLLVQYPDLQGFVCANEVCNLAVAQVLTDQGLGGQLAVVGCDNSRQQIQYLEQGVIQSIIIQQPFNMGYAAVEQAVRLVRGQSVPAFTEIPCVTITQDNMYNSDNQKLLFPF